MAGHSKFKNIQYRKGAQDKKRARHFSKLAREITAAVKLGGTDPQSNPRLRTGIQAARAANMPKDNIARALTKGSDADAANYESVRYEGFGAGGIALIIETLTDNRNRTASGVRALLTRHGGGLGETNSVAFMFEKRGEIVYPALDMEEDALLEAAMDSGAQDWRKDADAHVFFCAPDDVHATAQALEAKLGEAALVRLVFHPKEPPTPSAAQRESLATLLDALDDNDDVQHIYAHIADEGEA